MIDKMLALTQQHFPVEPVALGKASIQKVSPMTFHVRQFRIAGVGNLSVMEGKAMLGLMKMDTVILTPSQIDAPLFSYDRIHAMGNDTLILEFYDTLLDEQCRDALGTLDGCKEMVASIPDHDLGSHWYDPIKLPQSISKRGKKCSQQADAYTLQVFQDYLELLKALPKCDPSEKAQKSGQYVNGLFENGGPSTDAFVKAMGKAAAKDFFDTVIFGIAP